MVQEHLEHHRDKPNAEKKIGPWSNYSVKKSFFLY